MCFSKFINQKKKTEKKDINLKEAPTKSVSKLVPKPKVAIKQTVDQSSNYNVQDAIAKLRALKTKEELLAFVKGEKRVTVTRVIPAALNRL